MPDPMHFEAQAAHYTLARPPYPQDLWDTIFQLDALRPGCRVLDLGAGTGQATGPLVARGLRVTAVERGPQLAAQLKGAHPSATVVRARAEDMELSKATFDAVVAATSIHWLDLDVVLPKVHDLVVPKGKFLVFRNVFGDSAVTTPFREKVAEIVRLRNSPNRNDTENAHTTAADLTHARLFEVEDISTYRWSITLDEQQVRGLFSPSVTGVPTRWTALVTPCATLGDRSSSITPRG